MKKHVISLFVLVLIVLAVLKATPLGPILEYGLWPDYPKNKNETIKLSSLKEKAHISYDINGVPHIKANNLADLCRAIGFAHARYRGFQMDLLRKFSAGRLSELLGDQQALASTTVEFDLAMRGWNFEKKATFKKSEISKEDQLILNSYAEGVNAAFKKYPTIEHRILGVVPRKWEPRDTFLVGLLQAWSLTHNWEQEALRFSLALELGLKKAQEAYPFRPLYNYGTLKDKEDVELPQAYAPEVLKFLKKKKVVKNSAPNTFGDLMQIRPFASNAWVVKTDGKLPILHNDMHLTHSLPGLLFLQSISMPGLKAMGASVPGLPFLISGFNGKVAWGVTSAVADVVDLIIERPQDVAMDKVKINVRDKEPRTLGIRRSKNGPIFNDMYPGQLPSDAPLLAIKFETPNLAKSMSALYRANKASDVFELRNELMKIPAPIQNVMAADTTGNIGFFSTGSVPLRNNHRGVFPIPGSLEKYQWKGWTPKKDMPHGFNPQENFYANNNNLVHDPSKNLPLFHIDAAASYRFDRINEIANSKQSLEKLRSFQTDNHLLRAKKLTPIILSDLEGEDSWGTLEREALLNLKNWDFNSSANSVGATLFNMIYKKSIHLALKEKVSSGLFHAFLKQRYSPGVADTWFLKKDHSLWSGGRGEVITLAFKDTIRELALEFGKDSSSWTWGRRHFIKPTHPFGKRAVLSFFNLDKKELAGGFDSLWKAHFDLDAADSYQTIAGPVYRFSIDLNDPSSARFITDTGASGWPLSPHYGDLYSKWHKGEMISISSDKESVATLELVP